MNARRIVILAGIILISVLMLPGQLHAQRKKVTAYPQKIADKSLVIVNGYGKDISGEKINYHSCHPEANSALLVRCENATQRIEWETVAAPVGADTITFAWIVGYSARTSKTDHTYQVYINGKKYFTFVTETGGKSGDWSVKGLENTELRFKFGMADKLNDQFGYMFMKIPRNILNADGKIKISVTGDATGSDDWFMTFRYGYSEKVFINPEEAIQRGNEGKQFQRVKVGIDHFAAPVDFKLTCDQKIIASGRLEFGINYFYLPFERV